MLLVKMHVVSPRSYMSSAKVNWGIHQMNKVVNILLWAKKKIYMPIISHLLNVLLDPLVIHVSY